MAENDNWYNTIGLDKDAVEDEAFRCLYPFTPKRLTVNGRTMSYVDEGSGEPVVMVHGNPTWSFFYRRMITALKDNWRCLAPDHIGCGFSEKPQDYKYTLKQHIDNLENWLEQVLPKGQFNLMVHDWGGPTGLGYAVRHPERIKRLVVLNTSGFITGDMPLRIKLCRIPGLGAVLVRGLNLFAGLATLMTTVKPLPASIRAAFVMPYNSWANRVAVHRFVEDIPLREGGETHRVLADIDARIRPALAGKPLLVQWGMKDWCFTPYFLNLWRTRFPEAQTDEYQAGHYLLEDEGDKITARVRAFLTDSSMKGDA